MENPEAAPQTPEQRWDEVQEDNTYLEGQKEKFADNPEVQAKVMKYLEQNDAILQKILEDIDREEAGGSGETAEPAEMSFSELGSAAAKAANSTEHFIDKEGFVHNSREDALGNPEGNRGASFGRAS
ncbi:MAG: hypothetical protein ACK5MU_03875 [Candidatus Saccharimonadales bacterium]